MDSGAGKNYFLWRRIVMMMVIGPVFVLFQQGMYGCTSSGGNDSDKKKIKTVKFMDVTAEAGFNYAHGYIENLLGLRGEYQEIMGGVAAGDFDRDGWVDLYAVRGDIGPNLLFRNRGDGTFEEHDGGVGLTGAQSSGPVFADYDGDGWLDLLVGGIDKTPPTLFHNRGDGTFEDVTTGSGLSGLTDNFSSSFGDYDRDGDLDIFISHWLTNDQGGYLWRNNGDGTFTDVSLFAGIPNRLLADFTPNFSDIDNDGWPDLLIAADFGTSQVFHNNQNGIFTNVTTDVISDENGMGAAIGDYDNDGDLDWFVSSIYDPNKTPEVNWGTSGNRLYRNMGDGTFEDATDSAGVRDGFWGWGSCFADFNNDGYLDLFHVNGFTLPDAVDFHLDPSRLFMSRGDSTFSESAVNFGISDHGQGRGVVCFDYDRDGDIDIFIANNQQTPRLYRNEGGNDLNFLNIRLVGDSPNTEGVGGRIYVTIGEETQMRELRAGSNFLSQDPAEAHFGLKKAEVVDQVRIVFPTGEEIILNDVLANQSLVLSQDP